MDIKELLESDEGKAAITAAIEEATKPLVAKRDELLGKLKEKNDKLKEAEQREKDLADAKAKAEEEAILKSGDVEKITQQLEEKYGKQIQERDAKLEETNGRLHKEVLDRGLTDALTGVGVAPQYIEDLRIAMKAKHKGEITDTGATLDGRPIKDFITEWSQGDSGKHYLAAPNNGGGGSNGANGGGKAQTGKKADMSVKEKTTFIRENGKEAYDKLS